jgi:soluble lytic murein transglycosylase-like protein
MTSTALIVLFTTATQAFNLPQGLLPALCFVESGYDASAVHEDDGGSDSLGICQVKYSTSRWMGFEGTEQELMQPRNNIWYAAKYLAYQINRYGEVERGIVAYNRGHAKDLRSSRYSGRVIKQWLEGFE